MENWRLLEYLKNKQNIQDKKFCKTMYEWQIIDRLNVEKSDILFRPCNIVTMEIMKGAIGKSFNCFVSVTTE